LTARIGIYVCDCQGLVRDHVDTARLADAAAELTDVAFVETVDMLCAPDDLGAAVRRLKDEGCDRMLFAGCSPRSSLKFPEERIGRVMEGLSMSPDLFETANIREQAAWQHTDREVATAKAVDLLRMAHARLRGDEACSGKAPVVRHALVIGGGPAGLQTAKDLAAAGIDVSLVERKPWLGGHLCQLPRIFQSEGWPSICDGACIGPVQARGALLADRITAHVLTTVTGVEKVDGNFRVSLTSAPAFVNPDLCISCGDCAKVCPEETARGYDEGLTRRKAIDKEFERALPDTYQIDAEACTLCGDCVPVCPTKAIDLTAEPADFDLDAGAVFLATGFDTIDLEGYPEFASTHPDVVTSIEFERIMELGLKRPSDGKPAEQIVFVQCAGSRAGPEKMSGGVSYCSKTCCSVTAKQVDRVLAAHPMVEPTVVYYRDMRTYERALEGLYQKLKLMGIEFVNGEVDGIEPDGNGGLKLTLDPFLGDDVEETPEQVTLEADLIVLAAAQTPAKGAAALQEMFGTRTDRHGYPVESQPRMLRPTESLVDRVYVVGASSGPKVIQQANEQGSAAAMRALPSLLSGTTETPKFAGRVNPDRCLKCRTCETVCPHGAIRMTDEGAVIDPAFCQACGLCVASCPSHAAQLANFSDRQVLDQAAVAFGELPEGEPRILALLCYWCSYSAADFAGIERVSAPENYRVIQIRCSSSVNTSLLIRMFGLGVDGILVAGCPEKSCHHLWGNFLADRRIELMKVVMGQLGLNPSRLRFEYIGAPMQAKLMDTLRDMDLKLRALGPNPVALV